MKNHLLIPLFLFYLIPAFIAAQINPENIQIARDKWGVPHIFAKIDPKVTYGLAYAKIQPSRQYLFTHPKVTYGLAYAHAQDDFKAMQLTLLAGKGLFDQCSKEHKCRQRIKENSLGALCDFVVNL